MAYLLRFDGSDDNVDLTSPISATGDGVLAEIDFVYQGASNDVICGGTSFSDYWRINNDAQFRLSIAGSAANLTINTPLVVGERYTLRLVRTGSSVVVEDESGVALTPAANFNSNPFVIDKIGSFHNGSSNLVMDLYGFKANNGANNYSPSASNGTGQILPDTVVGNDGTLVNFPTDNSQWVFYDDGGVELELHEFSGNAIVNASSFAQISKTTQHNGLALVNVSASGQFAKSVTLNGNVNVVTSIKGTFNKIISGFAEFAGNAIIGVKTSAITKKRVTLNGNVNIVTSTKGTFLKAVSGFAEFAGNVTVRVKTSVITTKRVALSSAVRLKTLTTGRFLKLGPIVKVFNLNIKASVKAQPFIEGRVKAQPFIEGRVKLLSIEGRIK